MQADCGGVWVYLSGLGHSLVQSGCPTFDLVLDGLVALLRAGEALPHRLALLGAQLSQLGADLHQLVYVGLVLGYGLPQQLDQDQDQDKEKKDSGGESLTSSTISTLSIHCKVNTLNTK